MVHHAVEQPENLSIPKVLVTRNPELISWKLYSHLCLGVLSVEKGNISSWQVWIIE